MPWIESHTVLIRHKKLREFARELRIRPSYAMGHLHALWHAALEQREDGNLSEWSDEFIADVSDFPGDAPQYVRLLQKHGWLDDKLLHDWLDYVGAYLTRKYKTSNRQRLVDIWQLHGRKYGGSEEEVERKPTLDNIPNLPVPTYQEGRGKVPHSGFKEKICALFNRKTSDRWSYIEEHSLVEVANRPDYLQELDEITRWKARGEFFPQSVESLLSNWTKTLDRARSAPKKSILNGADTFKFDNERDRIEKRIAKLKNSYDSHQTWSDADKILLKELNRRHNELKQMLGVTV